MYKCGSTRNSLFNAFALTGRVYLGSPIPRAFFKYEASQSAERPWAECLLPRWGAFRCSLRKLSKGLFQVDSKLKIDNCQVLQVWSVPFLKGQASQSAERGRAELLEQRAPSSLLVWPSRERLRVGELARESKVSEAKVEN